MRTNSLFRFKVLVYLAGLGVIYWRQVQLLMFAKTPSHLTGCLGRRAARKRFSRTCSRSFSLASTGTTSAFLLMARYSSLHSSFDAALQRCHFVSPSGSRALELSLLEGIQELVQASNQTEFRPACVSHNPDRDQIGMQTCSGKTYTLQGTAENPGVTSHALSYLFKSATSGTAPYESFTMALSMLEIYNDAVFDLLTPSSEDSQPAFGSSLRRKTLGNGTCSTPGSRRSSLAPDSVTPRRKSIGRTEGRAESAARLDVRSDASGARAVGVCCLLRFCLVH
jgi:hypothetical protein